MLSGFCFADRQIPFVFSDVIIDFKVNIKKQEQYVWYFKKESVYFYGGNFACGYFLPDDAENVVKRVRDEKCIRECTF